MYRSRDYATEDEDTLLIRRQREQAADTTLSPANVRRVYEGFPETGRPTPRRMTSTGSEPREILSSIFSTGATATMATGVGAGTASVSTVPAGTASVGVIPSTPAVPSTSGMRPRSQVSSRGKEPRQTRRSRSRSTGNTSSDTARRRATRRAAERRFDEVLARRGAGGGGGGDDGDGSDGGGGGGGSGGGGGGGGGRRGRRDMHQNLDDLLNALRRRTGGRHIAGITHTDTITTTYKDGRPPTVHRTSSRASGSAQ